MAWWSISSDNGLETRNLRRHLCTWNSLFSSPERHVHLASPIDIRQDSEYAVLIYSILPWRRIWKCGNERSWVKAHGPRHGVRFEWDCSSPKEVETANVPIIFSSEPVRFIPDTDKTASSPWGSGNRHNLRQLGVVYVDPLDIPHRRPDSALP